MTTSAALRPFVAATSRNALRAARQLAAQAQLALPMEFEPASAALSSAFVSRGALFRPGISVVTGSPLARIVTPAELSVLLGSFSISVKISSDSIEPDIDLLLFEESSGSTDSSPASAESSTNPGDFQAIRPSELELLISNACTASDNAEEEDEFANYLQGFADTYSKAGINGLRVANETGKLPVKGLINILERFRALRAGSAYPEVLWMTIQSLQDASALVRDTSLVTLVQLKDKASIPFIEKAAALEPISLLRKQMERAVAYLQR